MRIAFDVTSLHDARTGVGAFTGAVLERLTASADLELVAFSASWRGRRAVSSLVPPGTKVANRPMAARPLRQLWRRFDQPAITFWTGRVDVVHGPNFVVPPGGGAAELATVHDLTCVRYPELCTSDVLQYPSLLRRALRRGGHIHVVSEFVREEVIELLGADPGAVHVVPNGVDEVEGGSAERGTARAGGSRYVLALGTVEPRKDMPGLVQAFDAVAAEDPEVLLVIAGPDGWGSSELSRAMAAAHASDRVVRLGWVDAAERADLLAGATVFAYPSLYEGFGLSPLEALAAGVPVVATSAGALREVLGDTADLVAPRDPMALAGAIQRASSLSDADKEQRIARGRERAAHYSWDRTAAGLLALYSLLAAR